MTRSILAVAAMLLILPTLAAGADTTPDPSVEERLKRLEEGFEQMKKVNEALLAENASLRQKLEILSVDVKQPAVKPAGKSDKLQLGGFVQVQGEAGDALAGRVTDESDRIFVRRARIGVGGNFSRNVDYRLEGEFAGTLGASSAMRAQMTDGYMTFTRYSFASVRTGQFKTPFGFEQLYSDTRLATPERSTVNDLLTPGRQLGVQIGGDLAAKRFTYALGAFNGNASNTSFNDDDNFMVAGRLASLLAGGAKQPYSLNAGINAYTSDDRAVTLSPVFGFDSTPSSAARDNVFSGTRTGYGLDAQLVAGRAEVWAEYLATDFEPSAVQNRADFTASGWYAQAGWFVRPSTLQVVGKYERNDPSDAVTGDDSEVWWLGANWFMQSHDIKLQLFYGIDDGAGGDGSGRVIARVQTMF